MLEYQDVATRLEFIVMEYTEVRSFLPLTSSHTLLHIIDTELHVSFLHLEHSLASGGHRSRRRQP